MQSKADGVLFMTPEQAQKAAADISQQLAAIRAQLPPLMRYSDYERQHSSGRMREGESAALRQVLQAAQLAPSSFQCLADRDDGLDKDRFEADLVRARLQVLEELDGLAKQLGELAQDLSDTVLYLGEVTKPVALQAYGIAKVLSKDDPHIQEALASAIAYYAMVVKRGNSPVSPPK